MKNILSGAFRVIYELLPSILELIGLLGTSATVLFLIVLSPCFAFETAFDPIEKKLIFIFLGAFVLFFILWQIVPLFWQVGTKHPSVKVKQEITVKVVNDESKEETSCENSLKD